MQSYPKAKFGESKRASRPRKRHFYGNRYTREDEDPSTSAKKLNSSSSDDVVYNPLHYYRIVEFMSVFGALTEFLVCRTCKKDVEFRESGVRGFGFKLLVSCSCGRKEINSGPLINTGYEINRRIVFVTRLLGLGREALNIFAGLMDIGKGVGISTYDLNVRHIHTVAGSVFDSVCKKAVGEEKENNAKNGKPEAEFKVSGDGSWKKRGFAYGVTTLMGYYTGKIIDLVVKSGCQSCIFWKEKEGTDEYVEWYERHEEECFANHSAGEMEVDPIKEMFSRSIEKFGVKYVNYVGDDSKTYEAILDMNPYGDDCPVIKNECVGHVERRMETRLRNVKKEEKLGEEGKLTDVLIQKLTKYYGLAIRRNVNSVEDMKRAIKATLDHLTSTNENPKHENCPAGIDSWCEWRKAEAAGGTEAYEHPPPLHPDVAKHLFSIYEALSDDDLLTRCLGGHTQSSNESFNSAVWRLAPKHLNAGPKIIEIASFIAACVFNEGYDSILKMMNLLDIRIGLTAQNFAHAYDEQRLVRRYRSLSSSKETRTAARMKLTIQNEFYEETEGLLYGPGVAV